MPSPTPTPQRIMCATTEAAADFLKALQLQQSSYDSDCADSAKQPNKPCCLPYLAATTLDPLPTRVWTCTTENSQAHAPTPPCAYPITTLLVQRTSRQQGSHDKPNSAGAAQQPKPVLSSRVRLTTIRALWQVEAHLSTPRN
jgi:hypothetical protein